MHTLLALAFVNGKNTGDLLAKVQQFLGSDHDMGPFKFVLMGAPVMYAPTPSALCPKQGKNRR